MHQTLSTFSFVFDLFDTDESKNQDIEILSNDKDWIFEDRSCLFVFLIFSLGFFVPKVNKIYSNQRQIITC